MQFNIVALAAFFATAMAGPVYNPCNPGLLYSVPQCCQADVLGVADLDCETPSALPKSPEEFKSICQEAGATAVCCSIPVLDQAVLCEAPSGTA